MSSTTVFDCSTMPSTTLSDTELLQNLYHQYDQLSEEEKHPVLLSTLRDILLGPLPTIYNMFSDDKFYSEIKEYTDAIKKCSESLTTGFLGEPSLALRSAINKIPVSSLKEKVETQCHPYLENYDRPIEKRVVQNILAQLWEIRKEMAETYLKNSAVTSSLVLLIQFLKLFFVWRDISKANNLLNESRDALPEIAENMDTLQSGVIELTQLRDQYHNEREYSSQLKIAREINLKVIQVNNLYTVTRDILGDMKLDICNCIERLDVCCNDQLMDFLTNSMQGIGNAFNYCRFSGMVDSGLRIGYGIATALSFLTAGANAVTYMITKSTLDEHRLSMRDIKSMELELQRIQQSILEIEIWLSMKDPT